MKYETLLLQDVQVIGMSKEIAFNNYDASCRLNGFV